MDGRPAAAAAPAQCGPGESSDEVWKTWTRWKTRFGSESGGRLHPSAPMSAKPRPHTLARAADRSSVRTPPPPPPIPGKVRVTPARTGGPSHRYVVGKNKLWFANATRTPPPQTEPTRLERHRHHCFSRPYAGTETATKCRDRRGTISLDWNNCVQCISKLRGAYGGWYTEQLGAK